jgi:hypothetical protein
MATATKNKGKGGNKAPKNSASKSAKKATKKSASQSKKSSSAKPKNSGKAASNNRNRAVKKGSDKSAMKTDTKKSAGSGGTIKLPTQSAAKKIKSDTTRITRKRDTQTLARVLPNLPTKEAAEKKMIKPVAGFQKTAAGGTAIVQTETANLLPTTHVLSQEEVNEHIKELIKMGRERGYITYDEMNEALPGDVVSPERLDQILMRLDELKVEVVEDSPEYRVKDKKDRRHSEPKPPVDEDGRIDDPVRTYLQQMGEIPLLTRDEEIALAKKIEVTRKRFQKRVLESHIAQVEAIRILGEVERG